MIECTIGSLLERAATAYAPRTAVIAGDRRISYEETISEIRRAGRALLSKGLTPGDRVALLMPDRPEVLFAYYGALWAGLGVVPINARLGAEDQQYILADSGAKVVVHDKAYAERLSSILPALDNPPQALSVDESAVLEGGASFARLCAEQSGSRGALTTSPDDLFGIYYTGGTTGRPKGVEHTHRTFSRRPVQRAARTRPRRGRRVRALRPAHPRQRRLRAPGLDARRHQRRARRLRPGPPARRDRHGAGHRARCSCRR